MDIEQKTFIIDTMSVIPITVFLNYNQYSKLLHSTSNFYICLDLSDDKRLYLLEVVKNCLEKDNFLGIVITINKNEILLERLFFLKNIVLQLVKSNKKVGVWGIPYCTLQSILGSYYYALYVPSMLPENSPYYSEYTPYSFSKSALLLACKYCIKHAHCSGLGKRIENHSIIGGRFSHDITSIGRDKLFIDTNKEIKNLFHTFSNYIAESDLTYSDRYVYFVKNVDYGSMYSFKNRFVYHCDFLPKHELEKELTFLSGHVHNKKILSTIEALHLDDKISRIAYSKAIENDTIRESFYVSPNEEQNRELLKAFNITVDVPFSYKLYGVGIDFYNHQIKSYKVYCIVKSHILMAYFPEYLEKIGIDISKLYEKEHYYSIRFDANKRQVSERIDLIYNDIDVNYFKQYIDKQGVSKKLLNEIAIILFAFDFEKSNMKKINMYYTKRLQLEKDKRVFDKHFA